MPIGNDDITGERLWIHDKVLLGRKRSFVWKNNFGPSDFGTTATACLASIMMAIVEE